MEKNCAHRLDRTPSNLLMHLPFAQIYKGHQNMTQFKKGHFTLLLIQILSRAYLLE